MVRMTYGSSEGMNDESHPLVKDESAAKGRFAAPTTYQQQMKSCPQEDDSLLHESPHRGNKFAYIMALLVIAATLLGAFATLTGGLDSRTSMTKSDLSRSSWLDLFEMQMDLPEYPDHRREIERALSGLKYEISGRVLFRSDNWLFDAAWAVWNQRVVHPPFAVIEALSADDISITIPLLIQLEMSYNVPWAIKAGGHSYAGWSSSPNGIVLSVSRMNSFQIEAPASDATDGTALVTMGPGTTTADFLKKGLKQGFGGIVASASTVCMGGFIGGGGLGLWSRKHGLGVDNVLSMQVVLADGSVVQAEPSNEYSDLFWALQGAGQATLGVVTEYKYKTYPAYSKLLLVTGHLPHYLAADFLTQLGEVESHLSRSVYAELSSGGEGFILEFIYIAESDEDLEDGHSKVDDLLHRTLPAYVVDRFTSANTSWYESAVTEAEQLTDLLSEGWNGFLMPDQNDLDTWNTIIDSLYSLETNPYIQVDIELWGGAIAEVDPAATAFPWRTALYSVGIYVAVPAGKMGADAIFDDLCREVDEIWQERIARLLNGIFVNYAVKSLETHPKRYSKFAWGENTRRLGSIKAKYDPNDAFHSALNIRY